MRALGAELRKLVRPMMLWSLAGFAGLVMIFALIGQQAASRQYQLTLPMERTVAQGCQSTSPRCVQRMDHMSANVQATHLDVDPVAVAQTPIGSLGYSAGLLASLPGLLVLLLLAGGHVAGEWTSRTMTPQLTQDGRRGRVVGLKIASLWIAGVLLLTAGWLAALLAGRISRALFGALPPEAFSASVAYAVPLAAKALIVLFLFCVLAVTAGVVTRSQVGTAALGLGVTIPWVVLARWGAAEPITFGYWVGGWMGFERNRLLLDHLWADSFISHSSAIAFAGIVVCTVVFVALSLRRMQRLDI